MPPTSDSDEKGPTTTAETRFRHNRPSPASWREVELLLDHTFIYLRERDTYSAFRNVYHEEFLPKLKELFSEASNSR